MVNPPRNCRTPLPGVVCGSQGLTSEDADCWYHYRYRANRSVSAYSCACWCGERSDRCCLRRCWVRKKETIVRNWETKSPIFYRGSDQNAWLRFVGAWLLMELMLMLTNLWKLLFPVGSHYFYRMLLLLLFLLQPRVFVVVVVAGLAFGSCLHCCEL